MKLRTYYRNWSALVEEHPDINTDDYKDAIKLGYEVIIGNNVFGKVENDGTHGKYYVETKHPYSFDSKKFNIHDDLISDEIREFIPSHVIREIRNAKSDFKKWHGVYFVTFEYLPLESADVVSNKVFQPISLMNLIIGDWRVFIDGKYVGDKNLAPLIKKYHAFEQSFHVVGEYLRYYSDAIVYEIRNLKSPENAVKKLLKILIFEFTNNLKSGKIKDESPEEVLDQIGLASDMMEQEIVCDLQYLKDVWRNGQVSVDTKSDAKYLIDLINNQNLTKQLASSSLKNPFSKYELGGVPNLHLNVGDRLKMKYSNDVYELVSMSDSGYTVAKVINGKREEFNSFPYNIVEHGLFVKA